MMFCPPDKAVVRQVETTCFKGRRLVYTSSVHPLMAATWREWPEDQPSGQRCRLDPIGRGLLCTPKERERPACFSRHVVPDPRGQKELIFTHRAHLLPLLGCSASGTRCWIMPFLGRVPRRSGDTPGLSAGAGTRVLAGASSAGLLL